MSDLKKFIFVSSSSDLAKSRKTIANELQAWLSRQGLSQAIIPYLWEEQTDAGRMLVDRMPIQSQLLDPFETFSTVPFVICMFGERCGVPLEDDLNNSDWERRIASWRAGADGRGLIHPWPKTEEEQGRAPEKGGFPLTGTVFELISAYEAEPELDNLVIGYVASRYVDRHTTIDDVFFNRKAERNRLLRDARNPAEEKRILKENYNPQIRALMNLLAFFGERHAVQRYATEAELVSTVIKRAQIKLRQRFGLASNRNPFKTTLEHWTMDDEHPLPGRNDRVRQVLETVEKNRTRKNGVLILIKGASGCGKSSLLHRGVLAPLSDSGAIVVALRPTDLEGAASDEDHVDMIWTRICERLDGCPSRAPSRHKRDEWMAKTLIAALEERNARLVIGLDQFEEVLDDLSLFKAKRYRTKRWWLVLRFLGRLAGCRRVQLIGTLETTRWKSFQALEIENALNLGRVTVGADVSADDAARIAQTGFRSVGINLEEDVLEEIKTQWDKLKEQQSRHGQSASPLPLACLRFAKLFEKFEDLVEVDVASEGDETSSDFAQASEGSSLSLEQIGGTSEIAFDDLIADLADEAWSAARQKKIEGWPIDEDPELCSRFLNFIDPLVGVDSEGHMRLLAATQKGADATTNALRASFRRVRLLVPAGQDANPNASDGEPLLRLVHQALVDRWEPARRWFEWRKDYLTIEDQFRLNAKAWAVGGRKHVRASTTSIQQAAQVLLGNRINWSMRVLSEGESGSDTRDYAVMLFGQASEPGHIVEGSIFGTTFAHLASAYQMIELLEKFRNNAPSFAKLRDKKERDLFYSATWCDGLTVPWLLSKKITPAWDKKIGWHPIVGAIQVGATSNYQCLVDGLNDLTEPIGPYGFTLLGQAARYGNSDVVRDLLDRGCDPESPDDDGRSALMWAAMNGEVEVFRLLLAVSDNEAVTKDEFRYTALHYAATRGHVEIIRTMLDDERVDEAVRDRVLTQRDGLERTPLFLAATFKHAKCLRLLLSVCDPRDRIHRGKDGETLFHKAVSGWPTYEEEKLRTKRTVEVLLDDGRLDPNIQNDKGKPAFEQAARFPEARRILRQSMSISYADMTEAMRRDDLQSTNPTDALRLIREEPMVLTDTHVGKGGLDILLDGKKLKVLAASLRERLVADDLLREKLPLFAKLATEKWAGEMRTALVDRLCKLGTKVPELPVLLDSAIRDEDDQMVEQLIDLGSTTVEGARGTGTTIFHEMAIMGETERFKEVAAKHRLSLPIDRWGRRPSDLAAEYDAIELKELEVRLFAPAVQDEPRMPRTTKFHDYAKAGDLKRFERQARGVTMVVPLDDEGRKPSEMAPEECRDLIAKLEVKYFVKVN